MLFGYKADERPLRLNLKDGIREVVAIEDRCIRLEPRISVLLVDDGDRYLLRHEKKHRISGACWISSSGDNAACRDLGIVRR